MAATDEMQKIALRHKPHAVCIVPEKREERTTEGGLEVAREENKLAHFIAPLREAGLTPGGLIEFHSRHKFQLLAHCEATYRRLGPMLADLKNRPLDEIADDYIAAFMPAMAKRISPGAHVNTMLHLMGFLRDELGEQDRAAIHEQIDAYLRGEVPLVVPMTMLRAAQSKVEQPYLATQQYLRPYPDALGLRNRV